MTEKHARRLSSNAQWPSSKITSHHVERLAVVYVRQSTPQQTIRHQESTRLQYGLADRALQLGWPKEHVLVIDEDLGRSGATAAGRPGFQRLVAEVGLDHVGLVLGIEMSRLARSCRDWYQLLEICSLFGTLIGDLDGVYDPSHYNDRLLLGLKGTMSEAESHVIKQRMMQGRLAKARRGELGMPVPIGYLRRPSGDIVKDPDEQAQSVVSLVFDQFQARGTLHGLLTYLVDNSIKLPVRARTGPNKGDLEWHRPNRPTLQNLLHNPIYAGAYVYGRRPTDPRRKQPGRPATGRIVARTGAWEVFLKDRLPAYISWAQYRANVEQLEANRQRVQGSPRRGSALLSGILQCGRCGKRMLVLYGGSYARYTCNGEMTMYAGPHCQSLAARCLDEHVTKLVLRALEPSALEVSLKVAEDIEAERRRLEQSWRQRLERAQYEVDRAMRQYDAVEPENRLLARTLEAQVEVKLTAHKNLQEEYDRNLAQQPTPLSAEERDEIRRLASDLPALWGAPTTTMIDRQTIIRQLVERITVTVEGESERVAVRIQWAGGHETKSTVTRPVARLDQLSYWKPLSERVSQLHEAGLSAKDIADRLNEERWRPAKRRATFNASMVLSILERRGAKRRKSTLTTTACRPTLPADEWYLVDLADELKMPPITLYTWLQRGWATGRRLDDSYRSWVVTADARELARLRALRAAPKLGWRAQSPTVLPS